MNEVKLSPISNREDYSESFQAMDENGDAIDLTGATIVCEMRPRDTTSNTELTTSISTTTLTISLTDAQTRDLCPGEYEIGCTIDQSGTVTQLFVGTISVVDGVVS